MSEYQHTSFQFCYLSINIKVYNTQKRERKLWGLYTTLYTTLYTAQPPHTFRKGYCIVLFMKIVINYTKTCHFATFSFTCVSVCGSSLYQLSTDPSTDTSTLHPPPLLPHQPIPQTTEPLSFLFPIAHSLFLYETATPHGTTFNFTTKWLVTPNSSNF